LKLGELNLQSIWPLPLAQFRGSVLGLKKGVWNFLIFFFGFLIPENPIWLNFDPSLSLLELTPGKRRISLLDITQEPLRNTLPQRPVYIYNVVCCSKHIIFYESDNKNIRTRDALYVGRPCEDQGSIYLQLCLRSFIITLSIYYNVIYRTVSNSLHKPFVSLTGAV